MKGRQAIARHHDRRQAPRGVIAAQVGP